MSYYRQRCLECHADRGCSLPTAVRLERSRNDDCAGCHMPRSNHTDIRHAATTDHRILRQPDAGIGPQSPTVRTASGRSAPGFFHRDGWMSASASRPTGTLVWPFAVTGRRPRRWPFPCSRRRWRHGQMTWPPGRPRGSRWISSAGSGGAGRFPDGPGPGARPGVCFARGGGPRRPRRATRRCHRLLAAGHRHQPHARAYHAELAPLYFRVRDWPAAAATGREALRLIPPTSRPAGSSSGATCMGTPRPHAANSRSSWDSIPPTATSCSDRSPPRPRRSRAKRMRSGHQQSRIRTRTKPAS